MKTQKKKLIVIVGLGSVGKRHAIILNNLGLNLIIIDPDKKCLKWASYNLKKVECFSNINSAKNKIKNPAFAKFCFVCNWGFQHFKTIKKMSKLGVKNFYV